MDLVSTIAAWIILLLFFVPMGTLAGILQYRAQVDEAQRAREEARQ